MDTKRRGDSMSMMGYTPNPDALTEFLNSEAAKAMLQHAGGLRARYGHMLPKLKALHDAIESGKSTIFNIAYDRLSAFDPVSRGFSISRADLDGLTMFKFTRSLLHMMSSTIMGSAQRLTEMSSFLDAVIPALEGQDMRAATQGIAEEQAANLLATSATEFGSVVTQFDKVVGGLYLATKQEYKRLRRVFLGESSKRDSRNDDTEDYLMMQFFGGKRPEQDRPLGPALALIDDNCILTHLLMDLSDSIPRPYEKTVPVLRKGKVTDKTRAVKVLDESEVEDFARALRHLSCNPYMEYVNNPQTLLLRALGILEDYYYSYRTIADALRELLRSYVSGIAQSDIDHPLAHPGSIAKPYGRINFLAIRPSAEDTAPKTKAEADYADARTELFHYLRDTINSLLNMKEGDEMEQYSIERVKGAIELKIEMDEVQKSEYERNLKRNITDDNEFYVSRGGNLGSLEVERAPAPKITYDDVIGESFVKARHHIEEVVKVASHANVMRLTAPRGDIKSNLLLIGPFGCGKTELARAVGSDRRVIGFNIATADLLTAYMHESVKNIKRMYDHAKDMRRKSRYTKPVALLMDEFDRLFDYGQGVHQAYDGARMTGTIQEMMDGVVNYEGVFIIAMTNVPKQVPKAVLRRFKYVDVVGQLTSAERAKLLKLFLSKGLPLDPSITDVSYNGWAEMLNHAPGDVIGKVADEIHFKFMHDFVHDKEGRAAEVEKVLAKRLREREVTPKDRAYVKKALAAYGHISSEQVTTALESVLKQPQVQMQIEAAKTCFREAQDILDGLTVVGDAGFGFGGSGKKRSDLWAG